MKTEYEIPATPPKNEKFLPRRATFALRPSAAALSRRPRCPKPSSVRKVSAKGLRNELGDSFQIPYSLSFLYPTQKQKKQTRTLSASFFYISPQIPIRAQCALKERIALACKHASGERVHPQDAPAGAGGGWAGANIRAPAGRAPSLIRYKAGSVVLFRASGGGVPNVRRTTRDDGKKCRDGTLERIIPTKKSPVIARVILII